MVLRLHAASSPVEMAAVGFRAPEFDLPVLGEPSRRMTLSSQRGRPLIVVFNCGCKACNDLDRELEANSSRLKDVQVLAVTMNPSAYEGAKLKKFRKATGFQWPVLVDSRMEATIRYNSAECPRVWLIDSSGVIRYHDAIIGVTSEKTVDELAQAYRGLFDTRSNRGA